ncbi:DUF2063 domain-containing protein [Pseudoroseicyclus sp. CXY001]|uniref:HvfC/BufC N-terminal domain-containing protein n=1 Tax=Pseudoroseicyclus sp. CXY001 TaxID=3242492 RepID=UPI0035710D1D
MTTPKETGGRQPPSDADAKAQGFPTALLDPTAPPPPGLTDGQGGPAGRRFDVYRNNVAVALREALAAGFPVTQALVGEAFFHAMAGAFARVSPPQSPVMRLYGAAFPEFIAGFPPAATLPYLADVARLEMALRESYHAADAAPVGPDALAAFPEARLPALRLRFAPATRLVTSAHPIVSIWAAHHGGPKPAPGPEAALVTRPGFDPAPHVVPETALPALRAHMEGAPLGTAAALAPEALPGLLRLLLTSGALSELA